MKWSEDRKASQQMGDVSTHGQAFECIESHRSGGHGRTPDITRGAVAYIYIYIPPTSLVAQLSSVNNATLAKLSSCTSTICRSFVTAATATEHDVS